MGRPVEKERVLERLRGQHPDRNCTFLKKPAVHRAIEQRERRFAKIDVRMQ